MNDWNLEKTHMYMERAKEIADQIITEKAAIIVKIRFGSGDMSEHEKRISYLNQELIVLKKIIKLIAGAYTVHEIFGEE